MENNSIAKLIAKLALKIGAIKITGPDNPFTWAKGWKTPIYNDNPGKYQGPNGKELQYVGDIYANFAVAEQYPVVLNHFAKKLLKKINSANSNHNFDEKYRKEIVFVGPQMGGIGIATMLALEAECRYACAEKKITQVKSDTSREVSEIVFARHTLQKGDNVIIVEDVLNNFSTTRQMIKIIEECGAEVIAISGLLNRSEKYQIAFPNESGHHPPGKMIPVSGLESRPFPEYKQDDPRVKDDILKGNVIWKPKDEWQHLMEVMDRKVRE